MTADLSVPSGMALIANERKRQQEVEGWTLDHDREHGRRVPAQAAAAYASGDPAFWPWDRAWWKPKNRLRDLIRAGALYLAALDLPEPNDTFWLATQTPYLRGRVEAVTAEIDALLAEARAILAAASRSPEGGATNGDA